MGSIRNRRKKITTLLTDVNSRIRNVELRSTSQQAATSNTEVTDETFVTPGSYLSSIAPSTWKRVIGGWYYPKQVTGLKNDRVEIFLNVDAGLEVDEYLEVSGINSPVEVSKKGKVLGVGQAVGEYRNNKSWYKPITAGATHALLYSVGAVPNFNTARALKTRFTISSFSATTTDATIVFSEVHNFNEGNVIDVSDLGGNMAGIDGLFFVATVPSETSITYKFDSPISAAIASTPATANKYVYATVHEYVELGDSWINTATDPDSLFVWDGIRWIAASDPSSVKKDDKDPGPPTNLSVDSVAYPNDGGDTKASATISWTAPTTNEDGSELTDLGGYDVEWSGDGITGADGTKWIRGGGYAFVDTSLDIPDLPAGKTIKFRVRTIDTGGRKSTYATISKLMGTRSDTLTSPSAPQVTTRLGTVTVRWNGLQSNGSAPPNYLDYLEVHVGSSSNFTPSSATLSGRINKSGNDFYVITDLEYNASRYVRLVFVDKDGKKSLPSTQVLVTIKPLVDTDIIGKVLSGANIVPGSINAADSIIGNTITGNLIQALTIETGNLKGNIITADKIDVGAVTAVAIRANAITADKIEANAITATKIEANSITADRIRTNSITADRIRTNTITAASGVIRDLTADRINAGVLTGRTVQTSSSGARITMDGSTNQLTVTNSSGILVGTLFGGSNTSVGVRLENSADEYLSLFPGIINLQGNNVGIRVTSAATKAATRISLDSRILYVEGWTGVGYGLIQSTSAGLSVRRSLSGSGNRTVIADSLGLLSAPSSDGRLKQDIEPLELGLNLIEKLEPKQFAFRDNPDVLEYGLVAQEVKSVLESLNVSKNVNLVFEDNDKIKLKKLPEGEEGPVLGIEYSNLIPALINSIKELKSRVEFLERERDK